MTNSCPFTDRHTHNMHIMQLLIIRLKVFVPLSQGGLNRWIFKFVCPGNAMSILHEGLLMLENGTVNINFGVDDFCKGKHVKIVHRRYGYVKPDSNGNLMEWPAINPSMRSSLSLTIPYDWEIFKKFIENNDIQPQWYEQGYDFGYEGKDTFNKTTGMWNGTSGMIQRGEADFLAIAIVDKFNMMILSTCFHLSAPLTTVKFHWFSRMPQDLSLTWNLLYLFPKE